MRKFLLLLSIVFLVALSACGETTSEEKEVASVNKDDTEKTNEEEESDASEEPEESTYDEVLLDDDVAIITLVSIETVKDDTFGDEHKIKLEIENKSDETIVIQSEQVSIDGLMVDDMVAFSETVAGGKRANGNLDIMSFDDELPELNENLEFILLVLDDETYERISETDVSVDLK